MSKDDMINRDNPVYGLMGRKVSPTGSDSWESQCRQAEIPDRTITAFIGPRGERCDTSEALRAAEERYKRDFLRFKGSDGKEYATAEAQIEADRAHTRRMCPFIGMDGKDYETPEALEQANREYAERTYVEKPRRKVTPKPLRVLNKNIEKLDIML